MAIVNRLSAGLTNRDATPRVMNNPAKGAGDVVEKVGVIPYATGDSATSIGRICSIPSNARLSEILITAADFTTAGAIDVGLYRTTQDGGAVVDADLFASAVDLSGGPFANLDITREAGTTNWALLDAEKMLWEALGLTADPCIEYDIAATISTTFNGGSAVLFKVRYVA
jgi:hypothetical protein